MALIPNWKNEDDVCNVLENIKYGNMYDENDMKTLIENIRDFFKQEGEVIMEEETLNMTLDELESTYDCDDLPERDGEYWSDEDVRLLCFYVSWHNEGYIDKSHQYDEDEPSYLHPNE